MELISSGQKLLIDENFASAVEVFSKAIDADSESFDAYLGRAVAYHNLNFFDQALADYDRAAGLATSSSSKPAEISTSSLHQLHLFRGQVLQTFERHPEAEKELTHALEKDPRSIQALYYRAISRTWLGWMKQAVEDYTKVLEIDQYHAETYINRASVHLKLASYEAALSDLDRAIHYSQSYLPEAHYNHGIVLYNLHRYEDAIKDFNTVLQKDVKNQDAYFFRGLARAQLQQHEAAVRDFTNSLKFHLEKESKQIREEEEALYNRALSLHALERYNKALDDFNRLIQINSHDARYFNNRGVTHRTLKSTTEALKDFEKAIELDTRYPSAHFNRASILLAQGLPEKAEAEFTKVIELDPQNDLAFINRGTARAQLNKLKDAIADFTEALQIRPSNDAALLNRGSAQLQLENIDEALKDFEEAVRLDPKSSTGYLYRGSAKVKLAKSTENCTILSAAIKDLDKGIQLLQGEETPGLKSAHQDRADAYLLLYKCNKNSTGQNKKYLEQALIDLDIVIKLDTRNASAHFNRANILLAQGLSEKAEAGFTKAIELDPQNDMAFINRGTARVHLNNLEGAIADFTKALKIRPSNDVALLNRGSALLELDNIHGALKDFEEVVSLDPNSSTGYLYRGAAKIKLAKSTENCTILSVAIEDLDKGIQLLQGETSGLESAHLNRADAFLLLHKCNKNSTGQNKKQLELALRDLEIVIDKNKSNSKAYTILSETQHLLGQLDRSKHSCEQAQAIKASIECEWLKAKPTILEDHSKPTILEDHSKPTILEDHSKPTILEDHSKHTILEDHSKPTILEDHSKHTIFENLWKHRNLENHLELLFFQFIVLLLLKLITSVIKRGLKKTK